MSSDFIKEIIPYIINLILPCLQASKIITDTRILLGIGAILTPIFYQLGKLSFKLINYNTIIIKHSDPIGPRIMKYIQCNYQSNIKLISLTTTNKKKETIEALKKDILVFYQNKYYIYINIEKRTSKTIEKDHITDNEFDIHIKSKESYEIINEFINYIINNPLYNTNQNSGLINCYYIDIRKSKDEQRAYWTDVNITTNKKLKYVFISNKVEIDFCDRVKTFINSEENYQKKGINYKKSFLLYGKPGCGKTSLIKAICIEYKLPLFVFNLANLDDNMLISLLLDINNNIKKSEKYIVVLEDFDRFIEKMNNRYNDTHITEATLLNFLDGIDESYGRLTIITANNISDILDNKALCRPGRIDHIIELKHCDFKQVKQISTMYDFEFIDDEINQFVDMDLSPSTLLNIFSSAVSKQDILDKIKPNNNESIQFINDISEGMKISNAVGMKNNRRNIMYRKRNRTDPTEDLNKEELEKKKINIDKKQIYLSKKLRKLEKIKYTEPIAAQITNLKKNILSLELEVADLEKSKINEFMNDY